MSRVYITNKSGHDFSNATRFGELVYLSEGEVDTFEVTRMYRRFSSILNNSNRSDYLLITGLTVMNCVASAIMSRKHGIVNWLLFNHETGSYKARTIDIDSLCPTEIDVDKVNGRQGGIDEREDTHKG